MDEERFDTLVRVLGTGAQRRRVLAGLLASLPVALGGGVAGAKKVKGKGKGNNNKKCKPACGSCKTCNKGKCKPKGNGTTCSGGTCENGACICQIDCTGKVCGDNGCDGSCGSCNQFANSTCTAEGQCVCEADCTGKECGDDGCGSSCGTCQNGTCTSGGQCLCSFPPIRTDSICDPDFCPTCSSGLCCTTGQTCVSGSCGACPATPNPCAQEHFCGATSADNDEPFCYCMTSIDDDTTCTSVFGNKFQSRDCTSDADCETLVNLNGAELVCVDLPCLSRFMANPSISKICVNKGCEDPFAQRGAARSEGNGPRIRQFDLRAKN